MISSKVTIFSKQLLSKGIWDTAGAEKFESISEQYTRNSDAAIICYDVTDKPTFEKAKQWVRFVIVDSLTLNLNGKPMLKFVTFTC